MKELSIEEKAKRYDEAIEKVRKWYDANTNEGYRAIFEDIFSELKESEDERIRKRIIALVNSHGQGMYKDEMLAWLEKRGEASPVLSNSSNIGKDAWSEEEQNRFAKCVLTSCAMSFIDYLDAHKYEGKMCVSNGECEDIENAFHNAMWDRLHRYYCKYIEKQGEQKHVAKYKVGDTIYYSSFGRLVSFVIANIVEDGTDNPMYEDKDGNSVFEKDLVEQKPTIEMKTPEESLDIDFEKKELKKEKVDNLHNYLYGEQNPTWSEEDKVKINRIMTCLENLNVADNDILLKDVDWLKSLKNRVQPRQGWNEEDKNLLNRLIGVLDGTNKEDYHEAWEEKFLPWLKSLKERNTWKPSEEEMVALEHAINCYSNISPTNTNEVFILEIMKERLKNLTK